MFKFLQLDAILWIIFQVSSELFPVKILDNTVRPTSWSSSDQFHGHFNSRQNHTIRHLQKNVLAPFFACAKNTINLFSDAVGDFSFSDLIATYTIFTEYYNPGLVNETTILCLNCLVLSYTCLIIDSQNKILKRSI